MIIRKQIVTFIYFFKYKLKNIFKTKLKSSLISSQKFNKIKYMKYKIIFITYNYVVDQKKSYFNLI